MLFKHPCSSGCPSVRGNFFKSRYNWKNIEANRQEALDYRRRTRAPTQSQLDFRTLPPHRSYYTRRKFRPIYAKVMNSYANACRKSSTYQYQRYAGANSLSLVTGLLPFTSEMALFEFPFNELLVSGFRHNTHPSCCTSRLLFSDLGRADQATADGAADVDTWRGGIGQITRILQTVQGHGTRSGRGRLGHGNLRGVALLRQGVREQR